MVDFNLNQIPITKFGRSLIGVIRGNKVLVSWTLSVSSVDALDLVIFRAGEKPEFLPLSPHNTNGAVAEECLIFDSSVPVEGMLIIARIASTSFRLEYEPSSFHLHRLLSRDLKQVNSNLRWHGRIGDLDTRFFSACNSMRANPGELALHARCVVSFGYTAMFEDRVEMIERARSFCFNNMSNLTNSPDAQVKISIATLWAHIAIWNNNAEDFLKISSLVYCCTKGIEDYPKGAYNSLSLLLLTGSFLLFAGRAEESQGIFALFESHFKIAANKYVHDLISYYEFIKISQCAYLCKLGLDMAQGEVIHGGLEPLTPQIAWNNAHRFGGKGKVNQRMQDEGCKRYLKLIESTQGLSE